MAMTLMRLLKDPEFMALPDEDKMSIMAEVDPYYYSKPEFMINQPEFSGLSRANQYRVIDDNMPGFKDMSEQDKADIYQSLMDQYSIKRDKNNESFYGKFKNFLSDVAFDIGTTNRQVMAGEIGEALEPNIDQEQLKQFREKTMDVIEPVAEGTGAAIGAIAGVPAGPAGMAAGGGLGYGLVSRGMESVKQAYGLEEPTTVGEELKRGALDVAEGTVMSAGGSAPVPGLVRRAVGGGLANAAAGDVREVGEGVISGQPMEPITAEGVARATAGDVQDTIAGTVLGGATEAALGAVAPIYDAGKKILTRIPTGGARVKKGAARQAAATLEGLTSRGEAFDVAQKEAAELSRKTGVQYSLGEQRGDLGLIQKQQELIDNYRQARNLQTQRESYNQDRLNTYHSKKFGNYEIDDLVKESNAQYEALKEHHRALSDNANRLFPEDKAVPPGETGITLRKMIAVNADAAKVKMNEAESKIPNSTIGIDRTQEKWMDIFMNPKSDAFTRDAMDSAEKAVMSAFEDGVPTVYEAMGASRTLDELIGRSLDGMGKATPATRALEEVKSALHQDISLSQADSATTELASSLSGGSQEKAAQAYKAFRKVAVEEYFSKYKEGAVREATSGGYYEGYRLPSEKVPPKFMTRTGAQNLKNAIGPEEARIAMEPQFAYELNDVARNSRGEVTESGIIRFLKKNKAALSEYGLLDKYKDIKNARSFADQAEAKIKEFEKSSMMNVLGADSDKIVSGLLRGQNRRSNMQNVLDSIEGNVSAKRGLQRAVSEHLISKLDLDAHKVGKKLHIKYNDYLKMMQENDEALQLLYKDSPDKYKALKEIQNAYKIQARSSLKMEQAPDETEYGSLVKFLGTLGGTRFLQLNPKAAATRDFIRRQKGKAQQEIDKILIRALFEPDYADVLYKYANGNTNKRQFYDSLGRLMEQDALGGIENRLGLENQVFENWITTAPANIGIRATQLGE